ncbi:hypothetical protein ACSBR1_029676 [Camellia fascicularis]
MDIFRDSVLCFLLFLVILPPSIAQLSPSETRILLQIQQILEYPEALQGWKNWTSFCYLPQSPYLVIVCSENHITEFSLMGNRTFPSQSHIPPKPTSRNLLVSQETLSDKFSIGSFFRVLTKLSNLKVLSLVSLGLPATINRLKSLEKLNISSNFISREIPGSISVLTNLTSLVLADNLFNGSVPDMKSLQSLQEIDLSINRLGPEFPSMSTNLATIKLKNNSLRSGIPSEIKDFDLLQRFDVSGNKLVGPIPAPLFSLPSIQHLNLDDNQFNGPLSLNLSCSVNLTFVDISNNFLIGKLPACIGSNTTNRTVLSSWNCLTSGGLEYQHPYSFCQKEALAVIPPNTNREGRSKAKLGLILVIVGGVVGAVFAVGLLILIIFRRERRRRRRRRRKTIVSNAIALFWRRALFGASLPLMEVSS